jgi:hypothetical protein
MANMNDLDAAIFGQSVEYLVSIAADYPHTDSRHRRFDCAVRMPFDVRNGGINGTQDVSGARRAARLQVLANLFEIGKRTLAIANAHGSP